MILIPVLAETDEGWAWMPALLRRVIRFGETQPTEWPTPELCWLIQSAFVARSPQVRSWVAIEDGEAVAHLVAEFDQRRKIAFVHQLEIDKGVMIPAVVKARALAELEAWAKAVGATAIDAVTWHPPRVFARYGFLPHRTTVRRRL